jgi:hypothetical protein
MEETFEAQDIDLNPSLEPGRWITCDTEDAGAEDERVLFRAFVNAAIGVRALRVRSKGAPYICVLWTKSGESEPKITLCNQSGCYSEAISCSGCLRADCWPLQDR